jgi:hypothetical protein
MALSAEQQRLAQVCDDVYSWRRWGPYVSDRAWGTVREDYSPDGEAWQFLTHDHARSKAYRWGEDALAGWCDRYQFMLLSPAFWNRRDPILKERLFGLTSTEGNHGEDVKEHYYYLDCTPTHSYQRFLYKYPQAEYPYRKLIEENRRRSPLQPEYELLDTGIFSENRYFDIFLEHAKVDEEDVVVRLEAFNRGPDDAPLDILWQLWFRNLWGWSRSSRSKPEIRLNVGKGEDLRLLADSQHFPYPQEIGPEYRLGQRMLYGPPSGTALFTDNETNVERCLGFPPGSNPPLVKDAFHRHWIHHEECVNPDLQGTKAAIAYRFDSVPAGGSVALYVRLSDKIDLERPLDDAQRIVEQRRHEADEFFDAIHPPEATYDERLIQRQALAGMQWTKQVYLFDVNRWLNGDDPEWPPPENRGKIRNEHWRHLNSMRVLSVPDKWEYPWFAAWDLAFHCIPLALVDPEFAKHQLWIMLFDQFQHPNGQIPAYEWDFSDVNPPVHAWAVWRVYNMDRLRSGQADRVFLERCFHKLLLNFTWWVNRVDPQGNNVFEGGFLGLDNIAVLDRSTPCHDGSRIEQSDATGWMGMFSLNLMRMALELAKENRAYETLAIKFFQHYCYIAGAMKHMGGRDYTLWDETDGFFYDVLRRPDDRFERFRVRSLVGIIPLFAVERLEMEWIRPFKEFHRNVEWFLANRGDLVEGVVHRVPHGDSLTLACTVLDEHQLERLLARLWDESEFLAPAGVRSLSKHHQQHPYSFEGRMVGYEPGDAITKIKGGNSNWRGPVWFPTCFLLIESLRKLGKAFGDRFQIQPQGGGQAATLNALAGDLADRLINVFARNELGERPVFGQAHRKLHDDPHWRDYLLFYEFFHADTSAGLGASHQTGWTGLVASLIDEWRREGVVKP